MKMKILKTAALLALILVNSSCDILLKESVKAIVVGSVDGALDSNDPCGYYSKKGTKCKSGWNIYSDKSGIFAFGFEGMSKINIEKRTQAGLNNLDRYRIRSFRRIKGNYFLLATEDEILERFDSPAMFYMESLEEEPKPLENLHFINSFLKNYGGADSFVFQENHWYFANQKVFTESTNEKSYRCWMSKTAVVKTEVMMKPE